LESFNKIYVDVKMKNKALRGPLSALGLHRSKPDTDAFGGVGFNEANAGALKGLLDA
jgi:hypothetical protein